MNTKIHNTSVSNNTAISRALAGSYAAKPYTRAEAKSCHDAFRAENERLAADQAVRQAAELRAQRLDLDIAGHIRAVHAALGLDGMDGYAPTEAWDVLRWRVSGDPLYREWETDLYCTRYWDAQEAEAGAQEAEDRMTIIHSRRLTRILLCALGVLALAAGLVRHFGLYGRL